VRSKTARVISWLALLAMALWIVGCGGAAQPTAQPTAVVATQPPSPGVATTPTLPGAPEPAVGQQLWPEKPCISCHGAQAEGNVGPKLAGTPLTFDEVLLRVRTGKGVMPAFTTAQISDAELQNIYAWLESLAPPPTVEPSPTAQAAPTATAPPDTATATQAPPGAQATDTAQPRATAQATETALPAPTAPPAPTKTPLPPSGHLTALWEHVNTVKVKSDFAKDASPDIDTLHGYASQAQAEVQAALNEADLTMVDITDPSVRATINQVKDAVNQIQAHINAALATGDLGAAHNEAAQMAALSRLDAWPLASLAVKQAGYVGSVRVRVTDANGSPIQGALVTALTAPDPVAGITGGDGRVTLRNLAAVRLMQVKAYQAGVIYHEVNATIPAGGLVDAQITLPGLAPAGQAPAVANAGIRPPEGAGNAQVVFQVTATDPQGHDDIAEDQVFALNPDLGVAYVLRSAGGDNWASSVTLPGLARGTYTWYFFAVDHQCNTSNITPLTYTVR
jgi:mono/diheme cytochrome c family protein